jgi:hypothetical protein
MNQHKGLDDLLAAGGKPRRLHGPEVEALFASMRARLSGPPEAQVAPAATAAGLPDHTRPPFPVDVFPEPVARFARRVAAAMSCLVDFLGVAILVVSGAAIGAARSLRVKGGWFEKPGMYAVIVSRPGTTKTPALRAVMKPIYEEQDRLYQDYRAALQKYAEDTEAYKQAKRNHEEGVPSPAAPAEPPPLRHLFAADTTVEELANNLQENRKGILVFRDELTAWVRALDQYKGRGTDRQFFLSAWSGEMVKVDRKIHHGRPIIIPHPFVSVLGGIQPDLLTELEAQGGREDGFLHRILFSCPPEGTVAGWTDAEISEHDENEWKLIVCRLLNLEPARPEGASEHPKPLYFNAAGRQAFVAWYDALVAEMNDEDFPPGLFGPWAKLKSYCSRFALVIHLLRVAAGEAGSDQDEGQVDAEDVTRAARLCEYFKAHFRVVWGRLQQSKEDLQVQDLVRWMRRKGKTDCTVRDVCRAGVCGITKASDAQKLLAAAIDQGLGDWQGGPFKGGPEVKKTQHARETPAFVLRGQG